MNLRALRKAAREYERLTGMDPVQFKGCDGTTNEKQSALCRDVNWYAVHTTDIALRLSRLVQQP